MKHSLDAGSTLDLDVAGVVLRLRVGDADIVRRLEPRFAHFRIDAPSGSPPDLQLELLELRPHPGPPCSPMLDLRFEQGQLHLAHPRLEACVDARAGRARMRLAADEPLADLDYLLRVCCALAVFERGGLMLHAAALVDGMKAQVFFGPSGSGKTSLARRADGRRVLNDDLVVVMPGPMGIWQAHASPFSNPSQVQPEGPGGAPLAGLFRLDRAEAPRLEPMRPAEAIASLLASTPVVGLDPTRLPALMQRLAALVAACPPQRLFASMDARTWETLGSPAPRA